jgi:hypothetical protein
MSEWDEKAEEDMPLNSGEVRSMDPSLYGPEVRGILEKKKSDYISSIDAHTLA